MIKKYFSLIFMIIFIVIFSFFYSEEFLNNYEWHTNEIKNDLNIESKLSKFEISDIKKIDDIEFYYTPYKSLINKIVDYIDKSEKRVYVEVYMLTETRIKESLVRAHKKWIEVKVVLEKNPYKANWINNKHYNYLKDAWVNIVWSDPDDYSLNHSKFIIIDDLVLVSTWNFTYSSFVFNRDLFLIFKDKKLLNIFLDIFDNDFLWNRKNIYNDNLVLSPFYSRLKIKKLFNSASSSIDMYFQYISDENMEEVLYKKIKEWVKVRLIVSEEFYSDDKNKIDKLIAKWFYIKYLKNTKMHSKAILVDEKYLFIWSVNFSKYSFDKNREVWIILSNTDIIIKFIKIFDKDFVK